MSDSAHSYLRLNDDNRTMPLACTVEEGQQILAAARAHREEMVRFPSAAYAGAENIQLTEMVAAILSPDEVA